MDSEASAKSTQCARSQTVVRTYGIGARVAAFTDIIGSVPVCDSRSSILQAFRSSKMWLLDTRSGHLRYYTHPLLAKRPYAVLSHVWQSEEQVFRDVQRLEHAAFLPPSSDKSSGMSCAPQAILPQLSDKIRSFCNYASADGYELAWVDTCCIDSSSSSEVSEAVNAVYHWFKTASICYVWLPDVDYDDDPLARASQFRQSRWHKRLWALQELLAPPRIVFLSKDWHAIGTKTSLSSVIAETTGIPRSVLLGLTPLHSVNVAQRMSWASLRRTTRVEDEAYALMGLFDITLTTIYGEGRNAFLRLQEEILKQIPDQSIFLWGPIHPGGPHLPSFLLDPPSRAGTHDRPRSERSLLASSPADFEHAGQIRSHPLTTLAQRFGDSHTLPDPDYAMTGYGIRTALPVYATHANGAPLLIAVLACSFGEDDFIGLLLQSDAYRPRDGHVVGACISKSLEAGQVSRADGGKASQGVLYRAVRLSHSVLSQMGVPTPTVLKILRQRGVHLSSSHLSHDPLDGIVRWDDPAVYTYRVLFPRWRRTQLTHQGYTLSRVFKPGESGRRVAYEYVFILRHDRSSTGPSVNIRIGPCRCLPDAQSPSSSGSALANSSGPPPMRVDVWASRANLSAADSRDSVPPSSFSHPLSRSVVPHTPTTTGDSTGSPGLSGSPGKDGDQSSGMYEPSGRCATHDPCGHVASPPWQLHGDGGKAMSRTFTCHDSGELVTELLVTLDPAPNTAPEPGHLWSQMYTLDVDVLYFAGVTRDDGRVRRLTPVLDRRPSAVVRSWGYDPAAGKFMMTRRESRKPTATRERS